MGYRAITQIFFSIIALVIIFTYIKPTLLSIGETQDELFQYSDASSKAQELNVQLESLLKIEKSFKRSDIRALEDYLPINVDTMVIMSDITNMADQSDVSILSLSAGELELPIEEVVLAGKVIETDQTSYVDFSIEINASYESFKIFLQSIEKNKYPLEFIELSFGALTEDEVADLEPTELLQRDYKLVLRSYSYARTIN